MHISITTVNMPSTSISFTGIASGENGGTNNLMYMKMATGKVHMLFYSQDMNYTSSYCQCYYRNEDIFSSH
jgi:hypothetical protein